MSSVTKGSAKKHSTERVQRLSKLTDQGLGLTGIQQNRKDQRAKISDLRPFAQVSAAPLTFCQWIHRVPGWSQSSIHFYFATGKQVDDAAKVGKHLCDFYIFSARRN